MALASYDCWSSNVILLPQTDCNIEAWTAPNILFSSFFIGRSQSIHLAQYVQCQLGTNECHPTLARRATIHNTKAKQTNQKITSVQDSWEKLELHTLFLKMQNNVANRKQGGSPKIKNRNTRPSSNPIYRYILERTERRGLSRMCMSPFAEVLVTVAMSQCLFMEGLIRIHSETLHILKKRILTLAVI